MGMPPDVGIGQLGTYIKLTKLAKELKGGLEAHHLLEIRHLKRLFKSTREAPAVLLTKTDHAALTKALRTELPYGQPYTKEQISTAYKKVYRDNPEWLKVALDYLFN